jgi:hypothetical protein
VNFKISGVRDGHICFLSCFKMVQGLGIFGLHTGDLESCVMGAEASDVGWSIL